MSATLPVYQIDAFSLRRFGGNPAAIMPLQEWLPTATMQAIAAENNLSETAFLVPCARDDADYELRWFTPAHEVELCGHATLASAWLLFQELGYQAARVRFATQSGVLTAERSEDAIQLDFPARASRPAPASSKLIQGLGAEPEAIRKGANWMAVFPSENDVAALRPDFRILAELHPLGVIATAPGNSADVVSRYFAPSFGIDEDPVTGSAHCDLAPYWCDRLDRPEFSARQISARGGELQVRLNKESNRVQLIGQCRLFMRGEIFVDT